MILSLPNTALLISKCLLSLKNVLLSQHPVTTYGYAFFFSLTGYFGISFVLALIKLFGALVAVTGQFNALIYVFLGWSFKFRG